MNEELLQSLSRMLDEKLDPIKNDLTELNKKIDGISEQTADLLAFRTKVEVKLEELREVEEVTKVNCYDIAKLKSNKVKKA